jgi:hypothetical protein
MENNILYITKEREVFELQKGRVFFKGEFLDLYIDEEEVKEYSPNFRNGELVAIKTKKQFSKHFLIEEGDCEDLFSVNDTFLRFYDSMSVFSGKVFMVRKEDDASNTYFSEENGGFYYHADMLVRALGIYKEV